MDCSYMPERDKLCQLLKSCSHYFAILLGRFPEYEEWLYKKLSRRFTVTELYKSLSEKLALPDDRDISWIHLAKTLRSFKQQHFLRLGARNLLRMDSFSETVSQLSDLAITTLQTTLKILLEHPELWLPASSDLRTWNQAKDNIKLVILGMGKLGGRELNFVSDIDLLFLCDALSKDDARIAQEFLPKLTQNISRLLSDSIEGDRVFLVDLRLRPGGKDGELVPSLAYAVHYYLLEGKPWERLALIKAAPVAGDIALGNQFLAEVQPFVFRRFLDFQAIDEIKQMRDRMLKETPQDQPGPGYNVKLGKGGIREIEFLVQSLQLTYGGRKKSLRERNTLRCIEALKNEGLLKETEARSLSEAYIFLRELEHWVQLDENRQTHTIPKNPTAQQKLVQALGCSDYEELLNRLQNHTNVVRWHFERLFEVSDSTCGGIHDQDTLEEESHLRLGQCHSEALSAEGPKCRGTHPRRSLASLGMTRDNNTGMTRDNNTGMTRDSNIGMTRGSTAEVTRDSDTGMTRDGDIHSAVPSWLEETLGKDLARQVWDILVTPHRGSILVPQTEVRVKRWAQSVGKRPGFMKFLTSPKARENNVLEKTLSLVTRVPMMGELLIQIPSFAESFADETEDESHLCSHEIWKARANEILSDTHTFEDALMWLRRLKNERLIHIALWDINSNPPIKDLERELSLLADFFVQSTYKIVCSYVTNCDPESYPFVVAAMGRWGSFEMGYRSDLDLVFVYNPQQGKDGSEIPESVTRLIQRFVRLISMPLQEGPGYEVDMRLRPTGNYGPLVVTYSAWEEYYERKADIWEIASLLRFRPVIGHLEMVEKLKHRARDFCFQNRHFENVLKRLCELKVRIEEERTNEDENAIHIKLGRGGLVELEFWCQATAISRRVSSLNHPLSVTDSLPIVLELWQISESEKRELLRAYSVLRRLQHRIDLLGKNVEEFSREDLETLKLLGLWGKDADSEKYQDWHDIHRLRRSIRTRWEQLCHEKTGGKQ